MEIQINDVIVRARWKTVADSQVNGFNKMISLAQALLRKEQIINEYGPDLVGKIRLRTTRALGFYYVQARLI